jgi:hypothetical protein
MSAKDFVSAGASFQDSSGETLSPSQVKRLGIGPPGLKSKLVSCIKRPLRLSGSAVGLDTRPPPLPMCGEEAVFRYGAGWAKARSEFSPDLPGNELGGNSKQSTQG